MKNGKNAAVPLCARGKKDRKVRGTVEKKNNLDKNEIFAIRKILRSRRFRKERL